MKRWHRACVPWSENRNSQRLLLASAVADSTAIAKRASSNEVSERTTYRWAAGPEVSDGVRNLVCYRIIVPAIRKIDPPVRHGFPSMLRLSRPQRACLWSPCCRSTNSKSPRGDRARAGSCECAWDRPG